jgi:hypothetical protein
MNRISLVIVALLLTGCIVSPETPRASIQQSIPPPGFTPQTVAGQAIVAKDNLTVAQQAAAAAQARADEVQAAVMEATAIAQSTIDAQNFKVKSTQDALGAAIAQHAATATSQAIDAAASATAQSVSADATRQTNASIVQATQTAVAVGAMANATAQTAHERQIAFDLNAQQNQVDQQRAKESAEFMTNLIRFGMLATVALSLYFLNRILQQHADRSKVFKDDDTGEYYILDRPSLLALLQGARNQLSARPLLSLAAGEIIDQKRDEEKPLPQTFKTPQGDILKGDESYWQNMETSRQHAIDFLEAQMDAIGQEGGRSNKILGYRKMNWSADTWKVWKAPLKNYIEPNGDQLIDPRYPYLYGLWLAVKKREASVIAVDGKGNPVPLTRFD